MTTTTTKRPTRAEEQRQDRQKAIDKLKELVPPGATVYTILRHVSASGMSRSISLSIPVQDKDRPEAPCEILNIDWLAARALDMKHDPRNGGLKISGCGMDMGFAIVYDLGRVLYSEGFTCTGDTGPRRCPSNDHSNGDRDYSPHKHSSGGYALRHSWL